ncbi:hypothetical protein E2C01_033163 [Portunus trituberculatus]|uniref:C2H2-type domain-containing protein n=1 Tax=Portunus trituberculatus TaxID=210409 RepID=A0A5B7F397_PORTR|nr:hypothetical protein [Portunus trituberculatus]
MFKAVQGEIRTYTWMSARSHAHCLIHYVTASLSIERLWLQIFVPFTMAASGDDDDRGLTCPICLRTFTTYRGRRVHERSQHPSVYHETEAAALQVKCWRARWDPEELVMMADYEAKHLGATNINTRIKEHILPHRTVKGIKGAHRAESYKAQVHRAALPSSPASTPAPRDPPSPNVTSNEGSFIIHTSLNDIVTSGSPIIPPLNGCSVSNSPQPPPPHIMSEEEVHASMQQLSLTLGLSVPACIGEVEHHVVPIKCLYIYTSGKGQPSESDKSGY